MRESTAFTVEKTVSEGHISGENLAEDVVGIGFLHETAELTEKKGPCLSTTHAMCPFTLNRPNDSRLNTNGHQKGTSLV